MKIIYNSGDDTLRILFRNAPIQTSETHRLGLILDYDQEGRIIGLELATASEHISRPKALNFVEMVSTPGDEMRQI